MSLSIFGSLPDGAELLAVVDDYQYLAVRWVMRREATGPLDYYCPLHTWTATPAGQLAVRDATIAELRARVAELESILAGRDAEALAAPPTADPQPAEPPAQRKLPAGRVQCPHCKRAPWANKLDGHLSAAHPEQFALVEPAAEEEDRPDPAQFVLDGWRCAKCRSNTFAPGLHDITICMRCEATPAATNGHLAAA